MNREKLYELLEESTTKDIQVYTTMSIIYLIKARQLKLKDIIKDIKEAYKLVEKSGK